MTKETNPEQFTALELEVMKVLWETGPATVQVVHQRMQPSRPLAYNTVQTMLTILHRKGRVKRTTKDRAYVYTPAVTQERAAAQALQDLVNRLFGGRPQELLLSMVKTRQITPEQLAELQRMAAAAEEGNDAG